MLTEFVPGAGKLIALQYHQLNHTEIEIRVSLMKSTAFLLIKKWIILTDMTWWENYRHSSALFFAFMGGN